MIPKILLLLTLLLSKSVLAAGVKTIIWDGVAPSIDIAVGQERVIKFQNTKIQVGVPMEHMGITSAESNNGVVYLRSTMAFDKTRYRFREKETGKIYLIDISARQGIGKQPPIFLKTGGDADAPAGKGVPAMASGEAGGVERSSTTPVTVPPIEPASESASEPMRHGVTTLVRYAMQQVYSPRRLITHFPDIQKVAFDSNQRMLNIVPGAKVRARILGKWRNEDRYVTAIYLQNMAHESVDLDPRYLTGRHTWKASALMNYRLTAANSFGDATTLVTVSTYRTLEE